MGLRRIIKNIKRKKEEKRVDQPIMNLFKTSHNKKVLICYITRPFHTSNSYTHQNYETAHLIAESFSSMGYNVDVVSYLYAGAINYEEYAVIFGFGSSFERSFYAGQRKTPRIYFITGSHHELHNEMCLKSVRDFYQLSGIWLPKEGNVIAEYEYYSMYDPDATVILANGYTYDYCKSKSPNQVYSLNNNILGVFSGFKQKTSRNNNFLFLAGGRLLSKGLPFVLELARKRKDLNFYIVVLGLDEELANYYQDVLKEGGNVFLFKYLKMDSAAMQEIIETCSYSLAPSYIDGLPGGSIEPMSAGLIPIVSRYCGFAREEFIFEFEDLSSAGLNEVIDEVLHLDDATYFQYSKQVRAYMETSFTRSAVQEQFIQILKAELTAL